MLFATGSIALGVIALLLAILMWRRRTISQARFGAAAMRQRVAVRA
jgi:heme A synthase